MKEKKQNNKMQAKNTPAKKRASTKDKNPMGTAFDAAERKQNNLPRNSGKGKSVKSKNMEGNETKKAPSHKASVADRVGATTKAPKKRISPWTRERQGSFRRRRSHPW